MSIPKNTSSSELYKLRKVKDYSLINLILSIVIIIPLIMIFTSLPIGIVSGSTVEGVATIGALGIVSSILCAGIGIAKIVYFIFWIISIVNLKESNQKTTLLIFSILSILLGFISAIICLVISSNMIREYSANNGTIPSNNNSQKTIDSTNSESNDDSKDAVKI